MNRRSAITGVFALGALAGCQTGATPLTQLQTDAALVTAGVAAVAISVLATPNLSPDTAAKINNAVISVNAANQVIQQATATSGTSAQQLVTAIKFAAPLILALLNPASAEAIAINAALSLLPVILAAAGVPPTAAIAPRGVTMTPEQARLVLQKYSRK